MDSVNQAIPARHGLLRVVSNSELRAQEEQAIEDHQAQQTDDDLVESQLAAHIRKRMSEMRNFRNSERITDKLLAALRRYLGEYDATQLHEIQKFGGSTVYARIVSTKCRGATALLRDVYLGPERPWDIAPTPVPTLPDSIEDAINQLVNIEVATMQSAGQPIDPQMIADRVHMLRKGAERAAKKQAHDEAKRAKEQVDDILTEGGFYIAFAEFLKDLPIFPYAVIKGPVVKRVPSIKWVNGQPQKVFLPRMTWQRVSPFDFYWSPSAANLHEAETIERIRLSRADLLAVRDLPGYDSESIDKVLEQFPDTGFRDWWDVGDTERARMENREQWPRTSLGLIDTAEYHGTVSGATLLDWGMSANDAPDPLQEYKIQAWMVDRHVIKAQIAPTASQRPIYYVTSYEKIPGAIVGEALPDMLDDIQSVCNATLRALVNNLSISSGPQVVINDAVIQPGDDDQLYPWKRWHVSYDPMAVTSGNKPVDFFQPNANADVLLSVYERFGQMADEVSALPRYMMGNERVGGAGRTASGLAMLMGNAAKTLQSVAATIDRDVITPLLDNVHEIVMLTMPGVFRGDEAIVVKGVNYATKREQDRMRQLEFLQLTGNPIDMQVMGIEGRANILRSVAGQLGLDHERVVPDDDALQQQQQAMGMGLPGAAPPGQTPAPEDERAGPEEVRRPVEGEFTNQATGRPGMRAGG